MGTRNRLAVLRLLTPGDGALSSRSASRLDGELPPEGADLIRRALSPVRVQRPTAKDLYSYLQRFGSSLIARPTVTSAKLVTASVIRGSNARVEWRLELCVPRRSSTALTSRVALPAVQPR